MPGKPHPNRDQARARWEEIFGSSPPAYLSVSFMEAAVSYEAQCRQNGGLPAKTRGVLTRIADGQAVASASQGRLRPGAHLVRDWNGRTYQVEVVADGYRMDGRTWTSLSAIAKHITGTTWSGPRFFGLSNGAGRGG
ncbi:DUF2924 domain-containing protein [uncultured Roseovarius sp.]|uniref:DUF2924 domain-containing protein n=1 Tax=uncultured Roseovarius sp. TaxID=293344 RepID=UPI002598A6BC|nr:DUF2924 domain-containing protein [uncultured Roseovarius sp.]